MSILPDFPSSKPSLKLGALAWLSVLAAGVTTVRARSTRSIAHVLYDAEHPSDSLSR